ncbi:Hypotetical protein [Gulosibacter molinativorax]|nr:Hypotetical protein [Gulosibacter molinativorax]
MAPHHLETSVYLQDKSTKRAVFHVKHVQHVRDVDNCLGTHCLEQSEANGALWPTISRNGAIAPK